MRSRRMLAPVRGPSATAAMPLRNCWVCSCEVGCNIGQQKSFVGARCRESPFPAGVRGDL